MTFNIVTSSVPSLRNRSKTHHVIEQAPLLTSGSFPVTIRVKPAVLLEADLCLDPLVPMNVTACGYGIFVARIGYEVK